MAERRMFTKKITDSDAFIELSSSAQALYFHLNQGADDDGFNNQIQNAMFKAHATIDDLKVLMMKNFIIRFECGVIVIKHWRMHNTLRKDRYTPTNFQEELAQLGLKDNGAYTLTNTVGCQVVAKRLPQVSIGKDSIVKDSKESIKESNDVALPKKKKFVKPTLEEVEAYCKERNDGIDAEQFIAFYNSNGWMVGKTKMVSWKSAVITWEKRKKEQEERYKQVNGKSSSKNFTERNYTDNQLNDMFSDIHDLDIDI